MITIAYVYVIPREGLKADDVVERGEEVGTLIDRGAQTELYVEAYELVIDHVAPVSNWGELGAQTLTNDEFLIDPQVIFGEFFSEITDIPDTDTLSPPSGPVFGGTTVVFQGLGYQEGIEVIFGFRNVLVDPLTSTVRPSAIDWSVFPETSFIRSIPERITLTFDEDEGDVIFTVTSDQAEGTTGTGRIGERFRDEETGVEFSIGGATNIALSIFEVGDVVVLEVVDGFPGIAEQFISEKSFSVDTTSTFIALGQPETQLLTITQGSSSAGSLVITLNDVEYEVPISSSGAPAFVVGEIVTFFASIGEWVATDEGGGVVKFVADENEAREGEYKFDDIDSGALATGPDLSLIGTGDVFLSGAVNVLVVNPNGGREFIEDAFRFNPLPRISRIRPEEGPEVGGTFVIIEGSNFGQFSQVRFGATLGTAFVFLSPTKVTAVSPASTGTQPVSVENSISEISNEQDFTYLKAPKIDGVPALQALDGDFIGLPKGFSEGSTAVASIPDRDRKVLISGQEFVDDPRTRVLFGDRRAEIISITSTEITVRYPPNEAGQLRVVVVNPDRQESSEDPLFEYIDQSDYPSLRLGKPQNFFQNDPPGIEYPPVKDSETLP